MTGLTYADAGVDLEKADSLPDWIRAIVQSTRNPLWQGDIGGFSGCFSLKPFMTFQHPTLSSSTDGVGTKLKVAFMTGKHDTVGIDLVAMVVNDLIVNGSIPLFLLDYLATGKISQEKIIEIVTGIGAGCRMAGCALIGGETAEMPGFYPDEEYDLSAFGVGIFDLSREITGRKIGVGDQIIGLQSSGLHSNGYSLVRKICFELLGLDVASYVGDIGTVLGEELLRPTSIYVKSILGLIEDCPVHGLVNITGGGIPDNLKRILPSECSGVIVKNNRPKLPIFSFLQGAGKIEEAEMFRTFNNGVGFLIIVPAADMDAAIQKLDSFGEKAFRLGVVVPRRDKAVIFV